MQKEEEAFVRHALSLSFACFFLRRFWSICFLSLLVVSFSRAAVCWFLCVAFSRKRRW